MWNDTYLQQLTESEPFGGIRLREAIETEFQAYVDKINKERRPNTKSFIILFVKPGDNISFFKALMSDTKYAYEFINSKGIGGGNNNLEKLKDKLSGPKRIDNFSYYTMEIENETLLNDLGWKRNSKPIDTSRWKSMSDEMLKVNQQQKEPSKVIQNTGAALEGGKGNANMSWAAGGKKG